MLYYLQKIQNDTERTIFMNKTKRILTICALTSSLLLSSCSGEQKDTAAPAQTSETAEITTAAATTESVTEPETKFPGKLVDFSAGSSELFECSNGWTNGNPFNVTWRKDNVTFENEKMQLIIDNDTLSTDIPYSGGEYRSKEFYGYGRYEVSMKAIKNDGVVSSYFTYTGPSDDNPWDEIDIEILGKDTTKVQFNYYTNGKGNHEYMYDLGFDASENFHTYAFEWSEGKIVWYVDGAEAYSADENIPSTPGKIMANAWCGKGVDSWLKSFEDSGLPLTAEYEWFDFIPEE